ncbi:hypothetical protein [Acaryochloris marina]|uniref:hypothetical protein n=1 Tax=Acaryochloris marina TaxID=155978 RepID=UPI001BAF7AC4|nr:hypothetical protein [Acaryochloris marina]QUY43597.1 hypothetical protein I1H34_05540 [Acaryochloris marina S15]
MQTRSINPLSIRPMTFTVVDSASPGKWIASDANACNPPHLWGQQTPMNNGMAVTSY